MSSAAELVSETVVCRGEDQISGELDGSTMLMSVGNGEYYCLNGAGNRIWELIVKPMSVGDVIARLTEEFEVDTAIAERETRAFLRQMAAKGLVKVLAGGKA